MEQKLLKEKRVGLLTGGTGFIGFHLTRYLLSNGWVIHLIVRKTSNVAKLKQLEPRENLYIHDYDQAAGGLISVLKVTHPDVVFHLAAEMVVDHASNQISSLIESNILFGAQLLEAMAQTNTQRLLNAGTYWQHYQSKQYNPVNLYAATKEAFDCILKHYTESASIRAITLKLFDVYGPEDGRDKLFAQLERAYIAGETLKMSPGDQKLDLVYIDDVVRAFSVAADLIYSDSHKKSKIDYAVTSSKHIALRKVVEIYQWVTGRNIKINFGGRSYRKREVMVPWQGRTLPGWKASINLERGIHLMVEIANEHPLTSFLEQSTCHKDFNHAST